MSLLLEYLALTFAPLRACGALVDGSMRHRVRDARTETLVA